MQAGDDDAGSESDLDPDMKLNVVMPCAKVVTLDVNRSDIVGNIKGQIQARENIRQKQQRLIFGVHELVDTKTLAYYKLKDSDTITLLAVGSGGASGKKAKYDRVLNFDVQPTDPDSVKACLVFKHKPLKEWLDASPFAVVNTLYTHILEQKNSDRVILRTCSEFKEFKDVSVHLPKQYLT